MAETVFTNANIVLPNEVILGTITVDGKMIAGVGQGLSSLPQAIDCHGDYLIPGLVELHTDNLERHFTPRPNTHWPAGAAVINHDREVASAGITTVFDALAVGHMEDDPRRRAGSLEAMLEAISQQDAADTLKADHKLHLRCEVSCPSLEALLDSLIENPLVSLISVMDHTPGQRQFASLEQYAIYYQGKYGFSDDDLEQFMEKQIADQKANSIPNRQMVVKKAKGRGISLASHDDATVEHVDEAIEDEVTIAEFPTTVEAARASHEAGLAVLMGGPNVVRGKSHSGNASARDFAEAGHLDILSSDYVPASLLFAALVLEQHTETIDMPAAIRLVTQTPAQKAGLNDRGEIAEGKRADLVRFNNTQAGPVISEVWSRGRRVA